MSTASTSRPLPRPLHLVLNSASTTGLPTPLSTRAKAPLSAPLSQNVNELKDIEVNVKPNPRRGSGILYNTSSSKTRSSALGLGRSNSLGSKVVLASEGTRSNETEASKVVSVPEGRATEPITLAEKHADLLRFIAQKESKCLELRTQLAQHEADLLLLKRKWERIVSKGLPPSTRSELPSNVGSEVLDGIREGVQNGFGRVLAAWEPSPAGPSSQSPRSTTPQFMPKGYSQLTMKATSSSKRSSISTASSTSAWDRSSLSGSRSSASSLFDDFSPPNRRSSFSSFDGGVTACPSPETEEASAAALSCHVMSRNPSSPLDSLQGKDPSMPDDLSIKKREASATSTNSLQSPSLSTSVRSESFTPLSRQMTNWIPPGLNKKWEELKGSETLSKQSKRASILLNDVLAVIAPPIPPSPMTHSSTIPQRTSKQSQLTSHHNLDSSFFDPTNSETGSVKVSSSLSSLLDQNDECKFGEVLQPQVMVPGVPKEVVQNNNREDKEEEVWNW